jgi:large subunit ribosomal protein L4
MMEALAVYSRKGEKTGSYTVPAEIADFQPNRDVIYYAVNGFISNQAQGTAKTKGRSEVRGGGTKPWRQKGTGRARAGSIRSPLWRGGGTVFGPQLGEYNYKVNRKIKKNAILSLWFWKMAENKVLVMDALAAAGVPKTKDMAVLFKALNLTGKKVVVIVEKWDAVLWKSLRNLAGIELRTAAQLNLYDLINSEYVVTTKPCLDSLKEMFKIG